MRHIDDDGDLRVIQRSKADEPAVVFEVNLVDLRRSCFCTHLFLPFEVAPVAFSSTGIVRNALHPFVDEVEVSVCVVQVVDQHWVAAGKHFAFRRDDGIDDGDVVDLAAVGNCRDVARDGNWRHRRHRLSDGLLNIIVTADDGDTRTYSVPHTGLQVRDGDVIEKGKQLQDGALNPHDVLRIRGASAVHNYLIQEVLKVYRQQGVDINDKHIEVIVRQMMRKVRVEDANDTGLLSGAMADVLEVEDENERVRQRIEAGEVREDGEPLQEATYTQLLMGITKASLATDSFLSAASFQETTKVLTEAAIKGKVDHLVGLKENVIIGKLIPAGTGLSAYRHFAEELVPVTEEELQEEQSEEQATGVEALQEDAAQVLEETPGQDEQDQE